ARVVKCAAVRKGRKLTVAEYAAGIGTEPRRRAANHLGRMNVEGVVRANRHGQAVGHAIAEIEVGEQSRAEAADDVDVSVGRAHRLGPLRAETRTRGKQRD